MKTKFAEVQAIVDALKEAVEKRNDRCHQLNCRSDEGFDQTLEKLIAWDMVSDTAVEETVSGFCVRLELRVIRR